jgi:hypothetical protein
MFEANVSKVLEQIKPGDVVLDIGGWARPFNRANWVIDAEQYETRGYYGSLRPAQGGDRESFSKETWLVRDICEKTPFPFRDKELDYVMCSHTLEDIRDPLWVCSEMVRVAKRGYIEFPSRVAESCRGVEPGQVGWTHHRWLIDAKDSQVTFLMKYHMIHSDFRFSFPASYLRRLAEQDRVTWLFWDGSFTFSERTIHGPPNIAKELEGFVNGIHPYSRTRRALGRGRQLAQAQVDRLARRARRILGVQ